MLTYLHSLIQVFIVAFLHLANVAANEYFGVGFECALSHNFSESITALPQDLLICAHITKKNEIYLSADKSCLKWMSFANHDILWGLHMSAEYPIILSNGTAAHYTSRPTFIILTEPKCNESVILNNNARNLFSLSVTYAKCLEKNTSSEYEVKCIKKIYHNADNMCLKPASISSIKKEYYKTHEKYSLLHLASQRIEERTQNPNTFIQHIFLPKHCLKFFETQMIFNWKPKRDHTKRTKPFAISSGIDSELIGWFKKHTGWEIKTIERSFHSPASGILSEIENGSVNTRFHLYVMTAERYETVDFTVPLAQNPLCVLLRRAPNMPFTAVLRLPYQPLTWLCIGVTFIFCSFTWHILRNAQGTSATRQTQPHDLWRSVFDITQILLNGVCNIQADTIGQRLFLQVLVMITVVLTNAYSGQLLGFFASPPHYDNPQTLDEAVSVVRHLYSDRDYNFLMGSKDATNAMRKFLPKFYIDTDLLTRLYSIVQSGEDAYLLSRDRYSHYMLYKNLTRYGKHLIYVVPECMTSGSVAYPVTKTIPEYKVLNQFTMRVLEGGLYGLRAIRERNQLTAQGVLIPTSSGGRPEPIAMTLNQFSASLLVLGVGLGVSSVAFVIELLSWQWKIRGLFCCRNCSSRSFSGAF